MSSGEPQRSSSDAGRQAIWGATAGLVVVAIVIAVLGSPLLALIPIAIVLTSLLFFFGSLA